MERLDSSHESQNIKECVDIPSSQKIVNDFLTDLDNLKEACKRGDISDNELEIIEEQLIKLIEDLSGRSLGRIQKVLTSWINKDNLSMDDLIGCLF